MSAMMISLDLVVGDSAFRGHGPSAANSRQVRIDIQDFLITGEFRSYTNLEPLDHQIKSSFKMLSLEPQGTR